MRNAFSSGERRTPKTNAQMAPRSPVELWAVHIGVLDAQYQREVANAASMGRWHRFVRLLTGKKPHPPLANPCLEALRAQAAEQWLGDAPSSSTQCEIASDQEPRAARAVALQAS